MMDRDRLTRFGVALGAGLLVYGAAVLTEAHGAEREPAHIVGHRPKGCPHAFCGCEASLYLFGRIIAPLNLAWNWVRKFPRTHPAPRMAAVRRHHVMVLIRHVKGSRWLVHDGNSGGHLTREHVRSIAGYIIVDPLQKEARQWTGLTN